MPKVEPRLGRWVNRVLEEQGWSQREAARRAAERGHDLSFSTVQAMSAGIVPGPEKVLALALTAGVDPNRPLGLAGYPLRFDPSVVEEARETKDPERRPERSGEAFAACPA